MRSRFSYLMRQICKKRPNTQDKTGKLVLGFEPGTEFLLNLFRHNSFILLQSLDTLLVGSVVQMLTFSITVAGDKGFLLYPGNLLLSKNCSELRDLHPNFWRTYAGWF